jgi:endonuclease/exonuclease/phosphatase family metal-dependent hydrolase
MRNIKDTNIFLFSILFLFFLQAISDFIEAIYAFGLLVTAFTIEVTAIILLFTPLLLLVFHKVPSRSFLLALSFIAITGRLLEPLLSPGGKLVACGISVGAFMMLFPLLLYRRRDIQGWQATSGFAIALCLSIFLRTANSSLDLSESGIFQIIGWLLGILAFGLFWHTDLSLTDDLPASRVTSTGRVTGLAIGLASVVLIVYFAFASPTVIARWTGFSYIAIVTTLVMAITVFGILFRTERFATWLTRSVILGWNILFIVMLVLTILPYQIAFPPSRDAYPLDVPGASPLAGVFLFLLLVSSPILLIDFMFLLRQISREGASQHQLGKGFATAALFFLIMVFFHVFTTIYDYAPIIGPFFRDRFWFVYLLAGLGLILPLLLVRKEIFTLEKPEVSSPFLSLALGSLSLLTVIALYLTTAGPVSPQNGSQLKIMTYNIQQGYDVEGNKNLEGQLSVIREVDPDILGLQESDTARLANGNVDVVRYFADKLDMHSYYGPTTTTGTFGIALLSKYPIQNPTTFFMYSPGEQTATIHAEIKPNGQAYQVFVTHLGNGGPMFQVEDVLRRIQGLDAGQHIIAMGDFNLKPPTEQYALITQTLADSWLLKWPDGKEIPELPGEERIDYIYVSPGLNILEAEYSVSPMSDHPYMYLVIEP